jgi:CPA2 family monovalent cation:H+ antiporter-2
MTSGLELTLLLLGSAVLGVVAFRMLHLPPMLGYLAVGVLIGPHALDLADNGSTTQATSEFFFV